MEAFAGTFVDGVARESDIEEGDVEPCEPEDDEVEAVGGEGCFGLVGCVVEKGVGELQVASVM